MTVNALPTVTASTSNSVICNSGTTSLLGLGADTYTWTGSISNGTPFSPTITTSYTVSGTNTLTGCTSTNLAVQTISVNPTPTVSISVISHVICSGNSPTLTAGGASTYTWNPGTFTTSVISPTLTVTTTYTLTGSSPAGCTSTNLAVQNITVNALPLVTANASSLAVCDGNTVVLNGGGANTYAWTGSVVNNVAFTPTATASYTVTGTDANNCQNSASLTVTVNPLPTVTANISNTTICEGTSVTLSGSGANTYAWTGGITDGTAFSPTSTASYTLTGTSTAGCTNTNIVAATVSVNALPLVIANVSNSVICFGNMSTLSGSGAVNYVWSGGVTDNVAFSPTTTATYTVTGTDANNCVNTANASITVNNLPVLSVTGTKTLSCEAETATLSVTGANSYTWNTGQNTPDIVITPTVTTGYTITGTDSNGCSNFASYTQSVIVCLDTLLATASVTNISCGGKKDGIVALSVTNTYSNSQLSYIWSPNSLCPTNDCPGLENLGAGSMSVTIRVTYTLNNILAKQDSLVINGIRILNENGPCLLEVFSGFSPNGDGVNDIWELGNITEFPANRVIVFTRWGGKVFEANGYDNTKTYWPAPEDRDKLEANTYFYIIDLGDGGKPIKGWVELIK